MMGVSISSTGASIGLRMRGEAMRDLYAHRESQRLIDQTRENTDSENNHDKTVSTRQIVGYYSLESGSGSHRRPLSTQERCSQPEAVATRLEAVLVHVNACHVIVAVTVCDPTDRSAEI